MENIETQRIINTVPDATVRKAMQQLQDANQLLRSALSGDMVLSISPATVTRAATAAAFTRTVEVALKTAAGKVHDWCNLALTTKVSVADASDAGEATIASTTLTLVKGKASIVVTGSEAAWLEDDTNTLTIATLSINGMSVTGGTSVETIVAA